jgi:hypothetical protein
MSANDWEKSWKSQLDKYDSPVDSSLFEAITNKAAVKSGSSYLFGWIGLGFVVLSSALIIVGFNNKSGQSNLKAEDQSQISHASITENKSALDLLNAASHFSAIDFEMNNSGKYVATNAPVIKNDILKSDKNNESLIKVADAEKSSVLSADRGTSGKSNPKISSIDLASEEDVIAETGQENATPGAAVKELSFEEAKVRFSATAPFSVLFPVRSKAKAGLVDMPDPQSCYSFNDAKGRSSFYVDAYVGAGNSIRSLSAIENQGSYMHVRDSLEKSWYNSAAGARIGFILASGMAIETGAEYQVHNEIFEYKNESEVRITYKYHYDQFGSVTRIDTITEIGARTLRTHNKYQQITIPLRLGYTMEKGRWMLGARLGVGLHIWNHQHGVILDNTYQTYKIEEDPNGYFNKNWGMQYNASLQIGYRILPQTFLMIEPIWNSQSSGITKRPYTIEQKYQTLRVNVGVRYIPGSY